MTAGLRHEIFLPGHEYATSSWKVKSGAIVQAGETIALAVRKDGAIEGSTTPSAAALATTTTTAQHKRPNRNRTRKVFPASIKNGEADSKAQKKPPAGVPAVVAGVALTAKTITDKFKQSQSQSNSSASGRGNRISVTPGEETPGAMDIDENGASEKVSQEKALSPSHTAEKGVTSSSSDATISIMAPADGILHISLQSNSGSLVIGYIEECKHPGFLDGLCVVCGKAVVADGDNSEALKDANGDSGNLNSSDPQSMTSSAISSHRQDQMKHRMTQVTVSGGITMKITEVEGKQIAQQASLKLKSQKKLALVLDLDHTLVHATSDVRAQQYLTNHEDVRSLILPASEGAPPGQQHAHANQVRWMQHFVKLRPNIREFLQQIQSTYELTVYTAGTREYAEQITVVLSRYFVGAERDQVDLDRLRHEVRKAESEYQKHQSYANDPALIQQRTVVDETIQEDSPSRKRQHGEQESTDHEKEQVAEQPPAKRRKVGFAPPADEQPERFAAGGDKGVLKSDHMTLARLQSLREDLRKAEEKEAEAMAVRQRLFGSRVVSRTDVGDLGRDVKSLKRIFPCGGQMAAVVDDREDVWANASDNSLITRKGEPPENLLLVRPYHWKPFLGFADINNAAGKDFSGGSNALESTDSENETDVQLLWTARILKDLHVQYYRQEGRTRYTVPDLLASMRRKVLKGTNLVLSGLVPLHKQASSESRTGPRHPIIRYAESLGAKVRAM